jgi:predicted O-linked N-acetylglucosamine transferase (SPINDLY family)
LGATDYKVAWAAFARKLSLAADLDVIIGGMATIPEAFSIATQHHQAGRLHAAEEIYRQILAVEPNHADAWNLLGVAQSQRGSHQAAIDNIARAIELNPYAFAFPCNLGNVYQALQRPDEAVACYRRTLELNPHCTEAHHNLGNVFKDQGQPHQAVACYRRALELAPHLIEAHFNLGTVLQTQGQQDEALACFRRALQLNPDYALAHNALGNVYRRDGRLEDAVVCYRRAVELKPDYAEAFHNLGSVFRDQGTRDEAVACLRRVLQLNPNYPAAHYNLGVALQEQGKLDEAVACYNGALALQPDYAEAHNNLGAAFKEQGKLGEAVNCYRRALQINPEFSGAHSSFVYVLNFCPEYDAKTIYAEHRRWNQQFAEPLATFIHPHSNERSANRRLRVGYVSPDFRDHVVGINLLPLFREHDRNEVDISCYAEVLRRDDITNRFQSYAGAWRNVVGMTHDALAQLIRQDGIDILVDLTLHMAHNRLLVFARKPAPVQVTFAGYPGTTGLSAIDYRLTDRYLDPPDYNDQHYAEESIRLPDTFWCYDPLSDEPAVNSLPAIEKDYVTFGCLNNFCKINASVLKLWAQVLKAVDHSQIMILAAAGTHRQRTLDVLEREGITPDRLTFVANLPRPKYLELYHSIDVGLDTFPYNGHTTSLDSFWMGVPVVTIVGQTVVGRAGFSQLNNLGLMELIADTPEQFVKIAVGLANDPPRLGKLRASLRERMQNSSLMDAPRFARNVEAAYRTMWQHWCAK